MTTIYYTFEIAEQHIGYSLLSVTDTALYSETRAVFHDMEINNIFQLKLENGLVTAFKYNENEWVSMANYPKNARPSSGYPLFLGMASPRFDYLAINEDSAETSPHKLTREGDVITETHNGKMRRTFWLNGDDVVKIDWGGAISRLCESEADAKTGTPFALN